MQFWQVILIISTAQYSTCVGKRQGFQSFVCRTAGYESICIRKVGTATDRPPDSSPVFSLPLSYRQMPWRCQRFQVAAVWFLCSLRNLNWSRWASLKYTNFCSKSEINSAALCSSFRPLHFHSAIRRASGRNREPAD